MVFAELAGRLSGALQQMSNSMVVDEKVLTDCLNEITRALLQADVQFKTVTSLCTNIRKVVSLEELAMGLDKRRIIRNAVVEELTKMLDSGKPSYTPQKGKTNVVMLVGLQGSGKTTTCTKYAHFYQKKGFKPALICSDTFRAGAFDQLKQNATKAKVPFYGSYTETDPAKVAQEGLEIFKREKCDLIIVDTSGRHKQEASLLEEMHQVAAATNPDLVAFVMDGSIGQAAFDQARAFKETVHVGAVIITKMDGHAKGGGALSAVATTKSPVIFIGTGEHMDDFEPFESESFVKRLFGLRNLSGFVDKIHEMVPVDHQEELMGDLLARQFTYRTFQNLIKATVSMEVVVPMLPDELSRVLMPKGSEQEKRVLFKKYMAMISSMSKSELESTNSNLFADSSQVLRVARGSGGTVKDVREMQKTYKTVAKLWGKKGGISRNPNARNMSKLLPPQTLRELGGVVGLNLLMQQIRSPAG